MAQRETSHNASLLGCSDTPVDRILDHVDRLMSFHTVEWFLEERNKEAVLKMNFTQDRKYTRMFQPDTTNSLPRVRDHIDRLSKSHRLRQWTLRETTGRATIVVAFMYEEVRSPEDLFFMNSAHLKLADDSSCKTVSQTPKSNCKENVFGDYERTSGRSSGTGESNDEVSLPYKTPLKEIQSPSNIAETKYGKEPPTPKLDHQSNSMSVIKEVETGRRESEFQDQSHKVPPPTSSRKKTEETSSVSQSMKATLKNRFGFSNSTKSATNVKGQTTQNPFSVNGVAAATKSTTGGRMRARSVKPPINGKMGTLQRSKSTSSIRLSTDVTREKHEAIAPQNRLQNSKNIPKAGFSSSRFTFRKSYNKSKEEAKDKNQSTNTPLKRKTEYLDDTDNECLAPGTYTQRPLPNSSVKSTQTAPNEPRKSASEASAQKVSFERSKEDNAEAPKTSKTSARDKSGDEFCDLYRLYFADSADASIFNSDVFSFRHDNSKIPDNNISQAGQYSSTPANKPEPGAIGDFFRKYFPDSSEHIKSNNTDHADDYRPRSSSSGLGESYSTATESSSSVEDNPQETTLTEASRTSESSEAFSCCTEPCLEDSAKDEIQSYYLKIYNQIQREPRVETDQLVWEINETGKICLYHKSLKQKKVHNLASPEELLELDQGGSSSVIPSSIKQQYVFRRLLEELDQVTFDNRALSVVEKKRIDRLMNKVVV